MTRSLLPLLIGVICFVTALGHKGISGRQVFYKPSLIAAINDSAKKGAILDYSSRLIVVLNGNSIIVVDNSKQVGYYLKNSADKGKIIWSNFKNYFDKLSSLQSLLKTCQERGEKFKLSSLKTEVFQVFDEVFNGLGSSSPIPEELALFTKCITQLRGPLSLVYKGSGSFRMKIGVDRFTKANLAVAELLSYSKGKLSSKNVDFNATQIFNAQSGAEVLLEVLFQAGEHADLSKVFDRLFTVPERVQSLLMNASSGSHDGLDGLITILVNYVGIFNGRSSINELISSILNCNARPEQSLSSFVYRLLAVLANQDMLLLNRARFSIYVSILRGIVDNSYTSDNISLSNIITLLTTKTKSSSNPALTLVELLSSYYPNSTIPHFFGSILKQFNQTLGSESTPGNSDRQIYYKPSVLGFIKKSSEMSVIIDYSSGIIIVLNGNRSSAIVEDISGQVRYFIQLANPDHVNSFWSNSEHYFHDPPSVRNFLKIGQDIGEEFQLDNLEESVRENMEEVFKELGCSLPMLDEISLLTNLVDELRGPLTAVYEGNGLFEIASGVNAFTMVNLAVAKQLSGLEGISDHQIFYKPSLLAFISKFSEMGVILDYSSRLIVSLNGNRSSIIVVDISHQVRYYLKNEADEENIIWSNFENYFRKLSSLQPLLETGQEKGEKSKLSTLRNPVRQVLKEVYKGLGCSSPSPEELALFTKFIEQLRGPLSLLFRGSGFFGTMIGMDGFMKANLVVTEMLNYSKGKLSSKNVNLSATQIFKAESGAEVLLNVLHEAADQVDLTKVIDGLLTSPERVQSLLINASTGSHDGLDDMITILANYVGIFNGGSSIEQLISLVSNHNSRPWRSLSSFVNRLLNVVATQDRLFHNSPGFSKYVPILKGIITSDYTSENISLSNIITLLSVRIRSSSNPLLTLVELLSSFYPDSTIPHFFGSILKQFNQTLGSGSTPGNVHVFYKPSLIGIINKSDKMGVIIDYLFSLIIVLNGKRSSVIVVDISEKVKYYLQLHNGDAENSIWSNAEYFFRDTSSTTDFLKIGQESGEKSKLDTLGEPIRRHLKEVFISLGGFLPMREELSRLTNFMDELIDPLNVVYEGNGSFGIASGVDAFTKVNKAVADQLSKPEGIFDHQVFYKPSLIAFISESAKMGVILDYSSRLIVLFNGKQSSIIVVDISNQVKYYLENEAAEENRNWSNFGDHFQKLSSVKPILKTGRVKGEKSKLTVLKNKESQDLGEVFKVLGGFSPMPEELTLFTKFIDQLRGALSLVYRRSGNFTIIMGVDGFMKANRAVAELLNFSKAKLSSNNVDLTATQIFKAQSGAGVLLEVLFQAGAHVDLIKVFDGLFTSPERVQSLLIFASSGSHDGLDGLLTIMSNYVGVFNGRSSFNQLISSVFNYNSRPGHSLSSFVNRSLTIVANQDRLFHNSHRFSIYVSILESIIDDNYTSDNISLSNIITVLATRTRRSRNPSLTLVELLSSFYPSLTIPHFFGSILKQFNQTLGGETTSGNVLVFYEPSLIDIINKSDKMGVIIDYSSLLIIFLNGKRSSVVVVDISEQVRYYLQLYHGDAEYSFWSYPENYFKVPSDVQEFLKIIQERGEKSKLDTSGELVRRLLEEVFNSLGGSLPMQEELSCLINLIYELRDSLNVVYKGSGFFGIASGVDAFRKVNQAMAEQLSGSEE